MLTVGAFVVRSRITRAANIDDKAEALKSFDELLDRLLLLEPTDEELGLAAELEAVAREADVDLDAGESQLLAILLKRSAKLLVTGDKRAIIAIASIAAELATGKVACLEQLIATMITALGAFVVHKAVCGEPLADKALAICFSCASGKPPETAEILAALTSYISDLRKAVTSVLIGGNDLSALAA